MKKTNLVMLAAFVVAALWSISSNSKFNPKPVVAVSATQGFVAKETTIDGVKKYVFHVAINPKIDSASQQNVEPTAVSTYDLINK